MLYPLSYEGGMTWKGYRRRKVSVAVKMLVITNIDVTPTAYDQVNGNAARRRQ